MTKMDDPDLFLVSKNNLLERRCHNKWAGIHKTSYDNYFRRGALS
jgi:hypothetical protein